MVKMLIFSIMLLLFGLIMLFSSMYFMLFNYELILELNIVSLNSMKMNMFLIFNYKTLLFMFLV